MKTVSDFKANQRKKYALVHLGAVRHGLEGNDLNPELFGQRQQQVLGLHRPVEVVARLVLAPCMVAADNHVRAAVVLADQGVLDSLAWTTNL